jgi:transposase-like protein
LERILGISIAEREKQILRVSQQGFHPQLNEALTSKLKTEVVDTVKTVLESALKEEVTEFLKAREKKTYRSGYYYRGVNTQYGQISDLAVPKLREGNKEREWQILERYQRSLGNLLDWMCVLYVMGLSLRDLQEALYLILGKVLSVSAVNQITLNVQKQLESKRQVPLVRIPKMILVDGVWVEIQYTMAGEFKEDESGHLRQCRQAEKRVVLAVMAIWEDGSQELIHYEVAETESEAAWTKVFESLIRRGLNPNHLELVGSDGSLGLPSAMKKCFPLAQQQLCITHKIRGIERHLNYYHLPSVTAAGCSLKPKEARKQRSFELTSDAYNIYQAPQVSDAQSLLKAFEEKWQPIEPDAVRTFLKDIELTFTFYQFDDSLHRHLRTTNHLERLFREFRTKSDEIGAFPNETSCLALFWLVVERDHAKHDRTHYANNS